jgi:hypothetical protein
MLVRVTFSCLQVGGMMVNTCAKFQSHISMDFENIWGCTKTFTYVVTLGWLGNLYVILSNNRPKNSLSDQCSDFWNKTVYTRDLTRFFSIFVSCGLFFQPRWRQSILIKFDENWASWPSSMSIVVKHNRYIVNELNVNGRRTTDIQRS